MRASKNLMIPILLLFISWNYAVSQGIDITLADVDPDAITNTNSTLQSTLCSCDRFSSICDDRCCCDTNCPADTRGAWKKQGLCLNKQYIYSFSAIPLCSEKRPKTLGDLQAGLRIYYQILKILFCVVFDNSEESDLFKGPQSDENIELAAAVASASVPTPLTVYLESPSGTSFTRVTIPRPSFGSSQCNSQAIILGLNQNAADCFVRQTNIQAYCAASNTFINPDTYRNLVIRKASGSTETATKTINVYTRDVTLTTGFAYAGDATVLPTGPTYVSATCTCQNFVSEVNYRFVVDSSNLIQSASIDVVVTSSESFTCGTAVVIKQKTSVAFVNSAETYLRLKGPGYRLGDPVLFGVKRTTTAFDMFIDPISFSFLKSDGQCALASDNADIKFSSGVQFGYRNTFTCSLKMVRTDFDTLCKTPSNLKMYSSLINNLGSVGIFPNANPTLTLDWVNITQIAASSIGGGQGAGADNCQINAPILSIFYSAIGEHSNPGFRINSAEVTLADQETFTYTTSDATGQTFNFKLYVDFIRLAQSPELFVAPNPTARLSLPDNVLTPFITKKT